MKFVILLGLTLAAILVLLATGGNDAEEAVQAVVNDRGAESAKLREAFCQHRPSTCAAEVRYLKGK